MRTPTAKSFVFIVATFLVVATPACVKQPEVDLAPIEEANDGADVGVEDAEEPRDTQHETDLGPLPEDGEEDVDAPQTPEFEIGDPPSGSGPFSPGTGRREFEPLSQGDAIRWEAGVQGGHHIWVSLLGEEDFVDLLDEETRRSVRHSHRIVHEDGTLLAQASRTGGLRLGDETWTATGLYAVLEAPRRPSRMDGDLLRYRLEVEVEDHPLFWREVWLMSECCD